MCLKTLSMKTQMLVFEDLIYENTDAHQVNVFEDLIYENTDAHKVNVFEDLIYENSDAHQVNVFEDLIYENTDAHQVKVFKDKALNLISENTEEQTAYEMTDGCAAQYKGKCLP